MLPNVVVIPSTQSRHLPVAATLALSLTLAGHTVTASRHVGSGGLLLAVIPDGVEGDGLALVQGLVAIGRDGGEVHEDVLATLFRGDEPEPLLGVEELDGSLLRHFVLVRERAAKITQR